MKKFSAGTVARINEHIIEFCFAKDIEIDQHLSVEILGLIMELSEGKPHALLYNFNTQNILLSDIARKLSGARSYSNAQMIARAIFTQSMSSSLEATHYIKNTNPAADTRVFSQREEAIEWLNSRVDEVLNLGDLSGVKP